MTKSIVILLFLLSTARPDLLFSSYKTADGALDPYFKEKTANLKGIFEDSMAKIPYAIAVADGVGGADFNSLYAANALTTRLLKTFYQKFPQGFQSQQPKDLRKVLAHMISQELKKVDNQFKQEIARVAEENQLKQRYPAKESVSATTFIGAFLEQREEGTAHIHFIQRGDSLAAVFRLTRFLDRNGQEVFLYKPIYKSKEQQLCFNGPYNLGELEECYPESLVDDTFEIYDKDLVVVASDGVWDNIFLHVLTWYINFFVWAETSDSPVDVDQWVDLVVKHSCPEPESVDGFGFPGSLPEIYIFSPKRVDVSDSMSSADQRELVGKTVSKALSEMHAQLQERCKEIFAIINFDGVKKLFSGYPRQYSDQALLKCIQKDPVFLDSKSMGVNPPDLNQKTFQASGNLPGDFDFLLLKRGDTGEFSEDEVAEQKTYTNFEDPVQKLPPGTHKQTMLGIDAKSKLPTTEDAPEVKAPLNKPMIGPKLNQGRIQESSTLQTKPDAIPKVTTENKSLYGPEHPFLWVFSGCTAPQLFGESEKQGLSNDLLPACFMDRLVEGNGLTKAQVHRFWSTFQPSRLSKGIAVLAKKFAQKADTFSPFSLNAYRNQMIQREKNPSKKENLKKQVLGGKQDDITVSADLVVASNALSKEPLPEVLAELQKEDETKSNLLRKHVVDFWFS